MSVSSPYVVFRAVDLAWPPPPSFRDALAGQPSASIASSAASQALQPIAVSRSGDHLSATQARVPKAAHGHRHRPKSRATAKGPQSSAPVLFWQGDLFLSPC